MNIYAYPGSKVIMDSPNAGHPADQDIVRQHGLAVGAVYTVERTIVGDFYTSVFLREFPGIAFNSVHFRDVE